MSLATDRVCCLQMEADPKARGAKRSVQPTTEVTANKRSVTASTRTAPQQPAAQQQAPKVASKPAAATSQPTSAATGMQPASAATVAQQPPTTQAQLQYGKGCVAVSVDGPLPNNRAMELLRTVERQLKTALQERDDARAEAAQNKQLYDSLVEQHSALVQEQRRQQQQQGQCASEAGSGEAVQLSAGDQQPAAAVAMLGKGAAQAQVCCFLFAAPKGLLGAHALAHMSSTPCDYLNSEAAFVSVWRACHHNVTSLG